MQRTNRTPNLNPRTPKNLGEFVRSTRKTGNDERRNLIASQVTAMEQAPAESNATSADDEFGNTPQVSRAAPVSDGVKSAKAKRIADALRKRGET